MAGSPDPDNASDETAAYKTVAVGFVLLLSGCASPSEGSRNLDDPIGSVNQSYIRAAQEAEVSASAPAIGLRFGAAPEIVLPRDAIQSAGLLRFGKDRVLVVIDGGRIVKTVGLPWNLGGNYAFSRVSSDGPARFYGMDFPDLDIFGAPTLCRRQDYGDNAVRVFGKIISTRHIVEHCTSEALQWSFDNEYWEDHETQSIWRSCQYIHPAAPPVMLEVLRFVPEGLDAAKANAGNVVEASAFFAPASEDCDAR